MGLIDKILALILCVALVYTIKTTIVGDGRAVYKKYYKLHNPSDVINKLRLVVDNVFNHFGVDPDIIHASSDGTSYTLNKDTIYINPYRKNGEFHSMLDLVEVCLHELAHVVCTHCVDIHDHSPEYYEHYNEVVSVALEHKIMNSRSCIFNETCLISRK